MKQVICARPSGECVCDSPVEMAGCNMSETVAFDRHREDEARRVRVFGEPGVKSDAPQRWQERTDDLLDGISMTVRVKEETILEEAQRLIYGARADAYGDAYEEAQKLSIGWSLILGCDVPPERCALMMVWLKLTRELNQHARDNLVDMAGYAGVAEKVHNGMSREGVNS